MEKIFLDLEKTNIELKSNPIFDNKTKDNINDNNNVEEKSNETNVTITKKNSNVNSKKKVSNKTEEMNMENKSLEEIYEYISNDNKVKTKKKNKKRNKRKSKKNAINNNEQKISEADTDDVEVEDPVVVQFKNDITEKVVYAKEIIKIKPLISENWIKTISSEE